MSRRVAFDAAARGRLARAWGGVGADCDRSMSSEPSGSSISSASEGPEPRPVRTTRATATLGFASALGFLAMVLHGGVGGGSFEHGNGGFAKRLPARLEQTMDLNRSAVRLALASVVAVSPALGGPCDVLIVTGWNSYGALNNIPNAPMVAISSNYHLSAGLDAFGQLHTWGAPDLRASTPSVPGVVQVVAGANWVLARDSAGQIVAWGENDQGQCSVPPGSYLDMDCGDGHAIALAADGTVRCWGSTSFDQCASPTGSYQSVGAGSWHSLAITASGSVVGWGADFGQLAAPRKIAFTKVVGGWQFSMGLDASGRIHGWGTDIGGALAQIPQTGSYVALDCNASRGVALRDDGRVVTWGSPGPAPLADGRYTAITMGYTVEAGIRCACEGELVNDGIVNSADLGILLNFWGTDGSQYPGVDLNGDGLVGAADLSALLGNWGPCPE